MAATIIEGPAEITIAGVADLHAQLREAIAEGERCTLDLGAVRRLDASGVQLLLAAARCRVALYRPSEAVRASLEQLGALAQLEPAFEEEAA